MERPAGREEKYASRGQFSPKLQW